MPYALNCAGWQCRGGGMRCGAGGCVQGVCHTPLQFAHFQFLWRAWRFRITAAAAGAYAIRPQLRGLAMSRRGYAVRRGRLCTGRMPYAPTIRAFPIPLACMAFPHNRCRRRGVWHTPGLRGLAMSRRGYAVRIMRRREGRMPYAPTYMPYSINRQHTSFILFRKPRKRLFFQTSRKLHGTWEKLHRT